MEKSENILDGIYESNLFEHILENEVLHDNWSSEMKKLKNLLQTPIPIDYIECTKENVEKLGNCITTPIENVHLDDISNLLKNN